MRDGTRPASSPSSVGRPSSTLRRGSKAGRWAAPGRNAGPCAGASSVPLPPRRITSHAQAQQAACRAPHWAVSQRGSAAGHSLDGRLPRKSRGPGAAIQLSRLKRGQSAGLSMRRLAHQRLVSRCQLESLPAQPLTAELVEAAPGTVVLFRCRDRAGNHLRGAAAAVRPAPSSRLDKSAVADFISPAPWLLAGHSSPCEDAHGNFAVLQVAGHLSRMGAT